MISRATTREIEFRDVVKHEEEEEKVSVPARYRRSTFHYREIRES